MNDQMKQWVKLYPNLPDSGQVVFILLTTEKTVYIAQCVYIGKNELGTEEILFYIFQVNSYIESEYVHSYMPVILPQPPEIK